MAVLAINGIEVYAYHGFYKEERILGSRYHVDVYLKPEEFLSGDFENKSTFNEDHITDLVRQEMKNSALLLERVGHSIFLRLVNACGPLSPESFVRVNKWHPPLGGNVDASYVEVYAQKEGIVGLKNIRLRTYSGDTGEERKLGNDVAIDISVGVDTDKAEHSDRIGDTVNYEVLYRHACRIAKKHKSRLEEIPDLIANDLQARFDNLSKVSVVVKRLQPMEGSQALYELLRES